MNRKCRACPQEHSIYLQAEPNWYRPTAREQFVDAVGCAASMAGILIFAVVLWLIAFGVAVALTGGSK